MKLRSSSYLRDSRFSLRELRFIEPQGLPSIYREFNSIIEATLMTEK
jgi:hypothetical protein